MPPANQIIRSPEVERVMLRVDRGKYSKNNPYMDSPQGIGFGVTISAPHMVSQVYLFFLLIFSAIGKALVKCECVCTNFCVCEE